MRAFIFMAHRTIRAKPRDIDKNSPRASSSERPRRSFKLPLQPLSLRDGLSRKSVSYDKLPEEPLKLSVLKLDGSCFGIEVAKTANIAELKLAVEAVFSHLPQKGPGKVSWSHVWGHFCLSHNGQKLLIDSDYVRDYAIKDGDQLCFTRHVSISYNFIKKRPKNSSVASKLKYTDIKEQNESDRSSSRHEEDMKLRHCTDQGCFVRRHGTRTRHLLGEWLSRCRIASFKGKGHLEIGGCPSKATASFVGSLKKVVLQCCSKKGDAALHKTFSSKRYFLK